MKTRVRSLEGLQMLVCPFCALRVIGDPVACTFSHEAPLCSRFGKELMARFPSFRLIAAEPTVYIGHSKGKPS
jgi:hypothetical protein